MDNDFPNAMLRQTFNPQHMYMLTFVHKCIDYYQTCVDKCQYIYTFRQLEDWLSKLADVFKCRNIQYFKLIAIKPQKTLVFKIFEYSD